MHTLDKTNKVGRLLAFVPRKDPRRNLSFFFPVEGLEQLEQLRKVTAGIQKIAETHATEYEYQTFAISDISQVRNDFPDVDETRIWWMDIESWIDEDDQFARDFSSQVLEWRMKSPGDDLPELAPGKVATEVDFFNQEKTIDQIWELISRGKNLLLAAPRRFGKTSLLKQLTEQTQTGVKACYVDLERGASAADFVRLILIGLMDRDECRNCLPADVRKQVNGDTLERRKIEIIRTQRGTIEKDWQGYGHDLFKIMHETEDRFLLILDEFSWLLEDMIRRTSPKTEKVRTFLEWFSEICQQYDNLSIIVTGSEHLDSYLEANKLPKNAIDHLEKVNLEPFVEYTAKLFGFLSLFKQNVIATPIDLKAVVELIGRPIPYFLQVFLDLLQKECHRFGQLLSGDFQEVYFNKLLGGDAKRYFEYVDHQIERYSRYGLPADSVKKILAELGQEEHIEIESLSAMWETLPGDRPFEFLKALLENDFYVVVQASQASMQCKLFRDYFVQRTI